MEYGRVVFCLFLCLQQVHGSVVQGLKTCEVVCQHTKECYKLMFDPVHLICITTPEEEPFNDIPAGEGFTVVKPAVVKYLLQKCSRGDKLIVNEVSARVRITSTDEPKTDKSRFLLMVSRDRDTKSATVMNVETKVHVTDRFLFPWTPVFSMLYSQKHKKLFLGLEKRTISTPPRELKATLIEPQGTLRMGLDEDSDLLFIVINYDTLKMFKLGQNERNVETVLSLNLKNLFHMDLDVQHKLIYITRSDGIYSYWYNGTETNRRISISNSSGLAVFQGYLYFSWNSMIMKTPSVNSTPSAVADVDGLFQVHDMKVFDNHVYISQADGNKDMLVIDISNSSNQRKLPMPGGETLSFCFV